MNFDWMPGEAEVAGRVAALFDDGDRGDIEALETAGPDDLGGLTLRLVRKLAGAGYMGLGLGPEGPDLLPLAAAQEELARVSSSLFLAAETTRLCGALAGGFGETDACRDLARAVAAGEVLAGVAVSEPGGAEPSSGWKTRAVRDGAGWRVSGVKDYVANGPVADWLAVAADADGQTGFFLVRPGDKGVDLGPRIPTLGHHGLAVASLNLEWVEVPADRVIGPFEDHRALSRTRARLDLALALAAVGVMDRAIDAASAHVKGHYRGPKPVFAHQEVRFKMADMFTLSQTARIFNRRAAWALSVGDREAVVLLNAAKVFAAEAAERTASLGLSAMGGAGYVSGHPVERAYREAKFSAVVGTTTEVARMAIADELIRKNPV